MSRQAIESCLQATEHAITIYCSSSVTLDAQQDANKASIIYQKPGNK